MDDLSLQITKALAYAENGGKPSEPKAGKSGEMKSIWQYTPATWKQYSTEVLGHDAPLSSELEAYVTHKKVSQWVDEMKNQGVPDEDIPLKIASKWNAGEGHPDAYKQGLKGTNKYGVKFDTPAYAQKVSSYVKQFQGETVPQNPPQTGLLQKLVQKKSFTMPNSTGSLVQLATANLPTSAPLSEGQPKY